MRASLWTAVCGLSVVLTAVPAAGQQPDPALDQLLARATWYALDFIDKLSNVVAEEHYTQDSSVASMTVPIPGLNRGPVQNSVPRRSAKHRELKADFLIVKSNGEVWTPFRDVFEVDHIPIRDREERLAKLFLNKRDADAEAQASEIANESARYNLGAVQRTINNPVFALTFLKPDVRPRFKFSIGKPDRRVGDTVRVVEFVEEMRPTIIRGRPGENMPAYGRFWIESETGRVVKAELRVDQKGVRANLTTVFRGDERLGIDVPSEMHEDYDLLDSRVTGTASYSRFRRFEVSATEEIAPPALDVTPPPR